MSEGLLCHCRMNPDGHEPASVLDCEAPEIKERSYSSRSRPGVTAADVGSHVSDGLYNQPYRMGQSPARGTCPVCQKSVQVRRIGLFAELDRPTGRWLPPVQNPRVERGYPLEIRPGMAPHKVKGAQCAGTGQVPAETRYTPGRELAGYLQLLAEEDRAS